ncbi:hypothetical protein GGE67_004435 [Rhizobium leucaenae]|nr:hypothetical protein [Rhizobium leucaenae]
MALIGKSGHVGDLRDREFTFGKQLLRHVQAQIYEITVGRHAECLGKPYDEVIRRNPRDGSKFRDMNLFGKMFAKIFLHTPSAFRGKPAI